MEYHVFKKPRIKNGKNQNNMNLYQTVLKIPQAGISTSVIFIFYVLGN
ncbi:hypothetical protein [Treponema pedis]|uniref:Uncharacterized protein n=2 Tax=Treponema pedis TaxID=409322 RepID=S6A4D4_9SPIR|nr:hypothetical protein [Treponema pedis]AGT44351.1 hypothetical protein TPE_1877 [Treponema pedis str. T A4]QOW59665.1 hypothetical protein IFE08_07190 [Treponema pedis]